jgi:hypothetical protein
MVLLFYLQGHLSLKKETEKESKLKVQSDRAVEVAKVNFIKKEFV